MGLAPSPIESDVAGVVTLAATRVRRRCAFLSTDSLHGYVVDDDVAYPAFASVGIDVERINWRDNCVDWDQFDIVIVRSTWDYHDDPDAFFATLTKIEQAKPLLANPLPTMHWNANKQYLRDVRDRGVPIVASEFGDRLAPEQFARICSANAGRRLVIKPTVSANAKHTYAFDADQSGDQCAAILANFAERAWLLQPFVPSIASEGEYSVFYFSGKFSHAIRKFPKQGDFRVQEEHGGRIEPFAANPEILEAAARVAGSMQHVCLYARFDFVRDTDGTLKLMELELIEPSLYLATDAQAPARFAAATQDLLAQHQTAVRE